MILRNFLVSHFIPISSLWATISLYSLGIKNYEQNSQNFIHSLLVSIIWILSSPQKQQLSHEVFHCLLMEVVKLLTCSSHISLDQVAHFSLCSLLLIFLRGWRSQFRAVGITCATTAPTVLMDGRWGITDTNFQFVKIFLKSGEKWFFAVENVKISTSWGEK